MNRRDFLPSLLALPAAATVTFAVPSERALAFVYPSCPRCGLAVMFMRRSQFVGDLVPVECGCGWKGVSPVAQ